MSKAQKVLIAGQWRDSEAVGTFEPNNPSTRQPTGEVYPVSGEKEVVEAVEAAAVASAEKTVLEDASMHVATACVLLVVAGPALAGPACVLLEVAAPTLESLFFDA